MTRVLDPLSAQLPTADPIRPKIAPASTSRPLPFAQGRGGPTKEA
jgi:hypothetical protein